jgi:hypothetical protein
VSEEEKNTLYKKKMVQGMEVNSNIIDKVKILLEKHNVKLIEARNYITFILSI